MTLFWIICAAMLLVAVLFVALPLWRNAASNNDVLRDAANLGILRDQSTELEVDLRNGLLTQEAYEQGKRELQVRLMEEVKTTGQPAAKPPRNPAKVLAIVLAVLLPLASVPIYLTLGNTDALMPQEPIVADADGVVHSEEALQRLEKKVKRLAKNPNDWWMLARTYTEQKRYPEALKAYERLVNLVPNEAQIWANYADVYAMGHGQTLQGPEVTKLLNKALELDANNTTALALSGSAAMERADYVTAIVRWQALISQLEPGSQDVEVYRGGIKQASVLLAAQPGGKEKLTQLAAGKAPEQAIASTATAITGKVALSPALAGKVKPTDIVFILARAAEGPKMPLAVLRKQVKDLPLKFTLDDSMAMQPQLKLSGFPQVVVVARVSKSGTPMGQSGDLQGLTEAIKPGTKDLNVMIDTVMP
ncbi:MAG: c-type cytochrome biogenesis protein CcmI [Nitrosomonadales bacterium]|nr:c-type cytochrome biogenesis protein CcmI [Nitrosomonadales bacterium]